MPYLIKTNLSAPRVVDITSRIANSFRVINDFRIILADHGQRADVTCLNTNPLTRRVLLRLSLFAQGPNVVFHFQVFDSFAPPLGCRFFFEVVIEKLQHAVAVVFAIGEFSKAMVFSRVLQHDHRFVESTQGIEVLDALVPIDRAIFIVVQKEKWCDDLLGKVNR